MTNFTRCLATVIFCILVICKSEVFKSCDNEFCDVSDVNIILEELDNIQRQIIGIMGNSEGLSLLQDITLDPKSYIHDNRELIKKYSSLLIKSNQLQEKRNSDISNSTSNKILDYLKIINKKLSNLEIKLNSYINERKWTKVGILRNLENLMNGKYSLHEYKYGIVYNSPNGGPYILFFITKKLKK